jgi:hypothetical protein
VHTRLKSDKARLANKSFVLVAHRLQVRGVVKNKRVSIAEESVFQ